MASDKPPVQGMLELPWMGITGPAGSDDRNFELLCCELAAVTFGLPVGVSPFGRKGQKQDGLDVVGIARSGQRVGIQAKLRDKPTGPRGIETQLDTWLKDVMSSDHEWDLFVIAVPWPADTTIENWVLLNNRRTDSPYNVEVWTSDSLNRLAGAHPGIVHRYFGADWAKDAWVYEYTERRAALTVGVSTYLGLDKDKAEFRALKESGSHAEAVDLATRIAQHFEQAGFKAHAEGFWSEASQLASNDPNSEAFPDRYLIQRLCESIDAGSASGAAMRSQMLLNHAARRPDGELSQLGQAASEVYRTIAEFDLGSDEGQFPVLIEAMRAAPGHDLLEHLALLAGEFALLRGDGDLVSRLAGVLTPVGQDTLAVRKQCLRIDGGLVDFNPGAVDQLLDAGSRSHAWRRHARRLIRSTDTPATEDDLADRIAALTKAADEALGERDGAVALQMWDEVFHQEQTVGGRRMFETERILRSMYLAGDHQHPIVDRMNRISTEFVAESDGRARDPNRLPLGYALCALNAAREGMPGIERESLRLLAALLERQGKIVDAVKYAVASESTDLSRRIAKRLQTSFSLSKFVDSGHLPTQAAAAAAIAEAGDFLADADAAAPNLCQLAEVGHHGFGFNVRHLAIEALGAVAPALENRSLLLGLESSGRLRRLPNRPAEEVSEVLLWSIRFCEDPDQLERLADLLFKFGYNRTIGSALDHLLDRGDELSRSIEKRLAESDDPQHQRVLVWSERQDSGGAAASILTEFRALPSLVEPGRVAIRYPPDTPRTVVEQWSPCERREAVDAAIEYVVGAGLRISSSFAPLPVASYFKAIWDLASLGQGGVEDPRSAAEAVIELGQKFKHDDPHAHAWSTAAVAALLDLDSTDRMPLEVESLVYQLLWSTDATVVGPAELVARTLARKGVQLIPAEALLEHPSWNLRRLAVDLALASLGNVNEPAIRRLMEDATMAVRHHVAAHVEYLDRVGCSDLAAEVRRRLAQDPSARVRWVLQDPESQCQHEQLDWRWTS